jgi:hypothetical protein
VGPPSSDEVLVADGVMADSQLEHPVEHQSPAARATAIEAEHELIEVRGQVGLVYRPLVGAQQPPLGQ